MNTLNLSTIKQFGLPETQFYKEETTKRQIVLHHTVSGPNATNVFISWAQNPERVATALAVSRNGEIVQGFSTNYWAHHLGLHTANNTELNKGAIGIEICNWGGLTCEGEDGDFYNVYGGRVPENEVIEYPQPFRGFKYFHKYTPEQIESVRQLLVYLCEKWKIPTAYNEDMWDISNKALSGNPGIYTHVSYRQDKSDCHKQPELLAMLQSL